MAETTAPPACTDQEYEAARAAGLLIVTTGEEAAIHKFAEAIRAKPILALESCARLLERIKRYGLKGVDKECCGDYAWSGNPEEPPVCCGRPYDLDDLIQHELGLIQAAVSSVEPKVGDQQK